jgi:hypothetical protein
LYRFGWISKIWDHDDGDSEPKQLYLREALKDVVRAMNDRIETPPQEDSTKGIRLARFYISDCDNARVDQHELGGMWKVLSRIAQYSRRGAPEGVDNRSDEARPHL